VTDYAGRLNRWDVAYGGRRFAHLAWRDMARWHPDGIAFESHTASHPRLPWVDAGRLGEELHRSRHAIADALGTEPTAIAYPFGAATTRETAAAARAGYRIGFALGGRWDGDPLRIPRHAVHCWSPTLPGVGLLSPVERLASAAAARCAVGTSVWLRLTAG
jgi:peptidoglycan/xylan/chitin deacetylase (PgdA/CDA1 family)